MLPDYFDTHHYHVGYYEKGYDIEAVAFQRTADRYWDLFFDFDRYHLKIPDWVREDEKWSYGYKIVTIQKEDVDENNVYRRFVSWLKKHHLIRFP
ncbi:DUF3986 family protein [Kroppenstedtia pulmonis]|uniref:DUF3986 family protein n=1 Tax=Kroppenstedtia pulmonis TaxID=1380685 RepID=A0A7D3XP35_9BACL|nr:DUF3986 family protein [Kroppenstedtia pulmonis]QKG85329.1 DUF3986 family protein [Kroppenstedtia pulmonis]